jgi:hypothetical protein
MPRRSPAIRSSPRPTPRPRPAPRPSNPSRATANGASGLLLPSLLTAGASLGTAYIGAGALNDTLNLLTDNPLLLAAVAGVAAIVLLR